MPRQMIAFDDRTPPSGHSRTLLIGPVVGNGKPRPQYGLNVVNFMPLAGEFHLFRLCSLSWRQRERERLD
jgi:hypothetical protein